MTIKNSRNSKRIISFLSVVLVLLSILTVFTSCSKQPSALSKEDILENVESAEENENYSYASSYISDFGLYNYDGVKFRKIELYYKNYYVKEMPTPFELAKTATRLFLEAFYGEVDLDDETAFTDKLIMCYVASVGDPYSVYRTAEEYSRFNEDMSGSFVGIGISVIYDKTEKTMLVKDVIAGSGAQSAGIKAGDFIVSVNGKSVKDVEESEIVSEIRGVEGTSADVTVLRDGKEIAFSVERKHVVEKSVEYGFDSENKIGYINIKRFKDNTAEQFLLALNDIEKRGAVGVVFDVRNNPGGYLHSVLQVIDSLVPVGTRLASYSFKNQNPTAFYAESERKLSIPCTVICNGNTASAGELFTSALRDYNEMGILDCTVVGETTYGKGVMQDTKVLRDNSALTFTVALYNPPSNVNYDGVGVVPSVYADKNQLEVAINELNKLIDGVKAVA